MFHLSSIQYHNAINYTIQPNQHGTPICNTNATLFVWSVSVTPAFEVDPVTTYMQTTHVECANDTNALDALGRAELTTSSSYCLALSTI